MAMTSIYDLVWHNFGLINCLPVRTLSIALFSIAGSIVRTLSIVLQTDSRDHCKNAICSARPVDRFACRSAIHSAFRAFGRNWRSPAIRFICPFNFRCNQRGGAKLSNGVTMGNFGWVFLRVNID